MQNLEKMDKFFNDRHKDYDQVHLSMIDGGIASKNVIADLLPSNTRTLLDLGIGTGLELGAIFARFPDIHVTGIDKAENMLHCLKEKYEREFNKGQIDLLHTSYLDYPFKENSFDAVISVMTLHHYAPAMKVEIYRNIWRTLKNNGVYIESDYMISELENEDPQAIEDQGFKTYEQLKKEQGLDEHEEYHFDTPCTVPNQVNMLQSAGFKTVEITHRFRNTTVIKCRKS